MGLMKILVCLVAIPFVIILLFLSRAVSKDIYDPVANKYIPDYEGKLLGTMGLIGAIVTLLAVYEYIFG